MKNSLSIIPVLFLFACSGIGELENPPDNNNAGGVDAGNDPVPGADAAPADDDDPPIVDDGRVKNGLIAVYKFDEGIGTTVRDQSDVLPALDLTIQDTAAVTWLPQGGVLIDAPTIIPALGTPTKIFDNCVASNEISFEAWIKPANLEQDGPARIVTYSIDTANRNFTLGQALDQANARLRTTQTNNNGTNPETLSNPAALDGQIQHVMYTRDAAQAAIYVNGVKLGTQTVGGNMENWQVDYQFALANEITLDRPWLGEIHLAAVYCRRLGSTEVTQNYEAGY